MVPIEDIASLFIDEAGVQNLTHGDCRDLEKHAYAVLDGVRDSVLRNMHIMDGV